MVMRFRILEDRTGLVHSTDFDDAEHQIYFHVSRAQSGTRTTMIYEMDRPGTPRRDELPIMQPPSVRLEFRLDESLGTVVYTRDIHISPVRMTRYLRKTWVFGRTLSRKFLGSDGSEYRWDYRSVHNQEWTCTTGRSRQPVAHFDLMPTGGHAYGVSGNTLTVDEGFAHLALELLTSLTIMRHMKEHNLPNFFSWFQFF